MKAILIDDEELALNYLEYQLLNIGDFEIIGKFTDPMIGKREIEKNEIDIVFLDIQTPKLNGIELAEQLLEVKP
ncbi:LytR/AlgR family response regulator transcription factor [Brevibacillus brevis]|uniref:LytR/AlgR family response regulator transcription factor n=1 Tax=Brevibacillus brevis TaxID=1393 RepID=UPI001EE36915|nr:response regulator [Brevibacillus brevis]